MMRVAFFSTKAYDKRSFAKENENHAHDLTFFEQRLTEDTAPLADGFEAICCFVNDKLDEDVLHILSKQGTRLVALRCAGFNNVDLAAADRLGITVVRVPAYSPHGVAEHAIALMMALNRKTHTAHARVRESNFSLEGLLGFDMHGKTAGVVGTGKIGQIAAQILKGFGCNVLAYDIFESPTIKQMGIEYVSLERLLTESDVISLHCPLTDDTYHLINDKTIETMKPGVMLVNTSRGGLIDVEAAIRGIKSGKIGYLGIDVYEHEAELFFEDLSDEVIQDDAFARLTTFPNVIITGHQAFFTQEALSNIAETTLSNMTVIERGEPSGNEVTPDMA